MRTDRQTESRTDRQTESRTNKDREAEAQTGRHTQIASQPRQAYRQRQTEAKADKRAERTKGAVDFTRIRQPALSEAGVQPNFWHR